MSQTSSMASTETQPLAQRLCLCGCVGSPPAEGAPPGHHTPQRHHGMLGHYGSLTTTARNGGKRRALAGWRMPAGRVVSYAMHKARTPPAPPRSTAPSTPAERPSTFYKQLPNPPSPLSHSTPHPDGSSRTPPAAATCARTATRRTCDAGANTSPIRRQTRRRRRPSTPTPLPPAGAPSPPSSSGWAVAAAAAAPPPPSWPASPASSAAPTGASVHSSAWLRMRFPAPSTHSSTPTMVRPSERRNRRELAR